jgi:iron complex outermembrane receptor protein
MGKGTGRILQHSRGIPARLTVGMAAAGTLCLAAPARAQDHTTDNVVTQAEDAFGFSVGRESIGIYSSGNARGFSPSTAGNVRIEGLYFDPVADISGLIFDSQQVRVGLSAQSYPFSAPSGVVDVALIHPSFKGAASLVINGDAFGTYAGQLTAALPVSANFALGLGAEAGHTGYPDGTTNVYMNHSLTLRWQPRPGIEIMPFWTRYRDFNDQVGQFFVPAGSFLPPLPRAHRYEGPRWAGFNLVNVTSGVLANVRLSRDWQLRAGLFRSASHQLTGYTNVLTDIAPDGHGDRQIYADPPLTQTSVSGEVRLTRSLGEGPRLHLFHLSLRTRNAHRQFDGSDFADFGPAQIGVDDHTPRPDFTFGPSGRIHVRQDTVGLAYDGRWKGVGELGLSLARANYRKTTLLPGLDPIVARARPWLYDATLALALTPRLTLYGGYARGLEESGVAPANAANRNAPLPAILTRQKDAGLRYALTDRIKLVVGVFDLTRPYFGFDAAHSYRQVGTITSRGVEFSVAGPLTRTLNLVAGGYFLDPRVERDASATGTIGARPVGIYDHLVSINLDWKTPLKGFSLDGSVSARSGAPGTTDNLVFVSSRTVVALGGRYRFMLAGKAATLRVQGRNLGNARSYEASGPGFYSLNNGRAISGYLAIDF